MTVTPSKISIDDYCRFVASGHHIYSDLAGEAVLLDLNAGIYHGLQGSGGTVWRCLQTPVALAEIVRAVCDEYDVTPAECRPDVIKFLEQLAENDLLEVQREIDAAAAAVA